MSLSDLIRTGRIGLPMTATLATVATVPPQSPLSVAGVAGVATVAVREAPEPIANRTHAAPLSTKEAGEMASLAALVRSVGAAWAFTPEEVAEALTHALAKPEEARACFEALAAEVASMDDDRTTCQTCAGRRFDGACRAAQRGDISGTARNYTPDPAIRRRCEAYAPKPNDPDQRTGAERWPNLNRVNEE